MSRREESRNPSRSYNRGRETDRRNDHRPRLSQPQHYGHYDPRDKSGPSHYSQPQQNFWQDNYSRDTSNKYNYSQQNSPQLNRSSTPWQSGGLPGQTQNYNQSWGGYNPQQQWWPNNQFQTMQPLLDSRHTFPGSSSASHVFPSNSPSHLTTDSTILDKTVGVISPALDTNPPLGSKEARDKRLQENRDILVQSLKESKSYKSSDAKEVNEEPSKQISTSTTDHKNKCATKSTCQTQLGIKEIDRPGGTHRRSSLESDGLSSLDTCKVSKPMPPACKRTRSTSLSSHVPSKCQSDKEALDIKQRVIQQLLGMNKNKLKEIVSNPRSRKFEFVMKYMMKESRSQQTQKERQLAQASIQGTTLDASLSQLDYDSLLSDPDLAINLSNLPPEMIETLGSIFSMGEPVDSMDVTDDGISLSDDYVGFSKNRPINISPDTSFEQDDGTDVQVDQSTVQEIPITTGGKELQNPDTDGIPVIKTESDKVATSLSFIADNYGFGENEMDAQPIDVKDVIQADQIQEKTTTSNLNQSDKIVEALDVSLALYENVPEQNEQSSSETEVRNSVLNAAEGPLSAGVEKESVKVGSVAMTTIDSVRPSLVEATNDILDTIVAAIDMPESSLSALDVPEKADENNDAVSVAVIEPIDPDFSCKETERTIIQDDSKIDQSHCSTSTMQEAIRTASPVAESDTGIRSTEDGVDSNEDLSEVGLQTLEKENAVIPSSVVSLTDDACASTNKSDETVIRLCDNVEQSVGAFGKSSKASNAVSGTDKIHDNVTKDDNAITDTEGMGVGNVSHDYRMENRIDIESSVNTDCDNEVLTVSDPMCILYESVDLIAANSRPNIRPKHAELTENQDQLAADNSSSNNMKETVPVEPLRRTETLDIVCPLKQRDRLVTPCNQNLPSEDIINDFAVRVKSENEVNLDYNYEQVTGNAGQHFRRLPAIEVGTQTEGTPDLRPKDFSSLQAMMKKNSPNTSIHITMEQLKQFFNSNLLLSREINSNAEKSGRIPVGSKPTKGRSEPCVPIGRQQIRHPGTLAVCTDISSLNVQDLDWPSDLFEVPVIDNADGGSTKKESLKVIFHRITDIENRIEKCTEIKKRLYEQVARILDDEKSQSDNTDGVPSCSKKKQSVSKPPVNSSVKLPAVRRNEKETISKTRSLSSTANRARPSRATSGRSNAGNTSNKVANVSLGKKNSKPSQSKTKLPETSIALSLSRTRSPNFKSPSKIPPASIKVETSPRNIRRKKKTGYSTPVKTTNQKPSPASDLNSPTDSLRSSRSTRSLSANVNNLNTPNSSSSSTRNLRNSEPVAKPSPLPSRKTKAELKEIILDSSFSESDYASNAESDSHANLSTRSTRRSICEPLEILVLPETRKRSRRSADTVMGTSSQEDKSCKDSSPKQAVSVTLKRCCVVIEQLKHPTKRQRRLEKELEVVEITPTPEEKQENNCDIDLNEDLNTVAQENSPLSCAFTQSSDDEDDVPLGIVVNKMKTLPSFKILKDEIDQVSVSSSDNGTNPSVESRNDDKKSKKSKLKKSKRKSESGDILEHHSSKHDHLEFVEHERGIILDIKVVGRFILAASNTGTVFSYSIKSGKLKKQYEGHAGPITCLCVIDSDFESESKYPEKLVTGSHDNYLRCFMLKSAEQIHTPLQVGSAIAIDHNWGTIYIGTSYGEVVKVDTKTFMVVDEHMKFSTTAILEIKATKEGPRRVLIIGTRNEAITVRDADTGLLLRSVSGHQPANSLLLEKGLVYCGTVDGKVPVFDFTCGKEMFRFNCGPGVRCMKIYHGLLFAGCYDGFIYVFNISDQTLVAKLPGTGRMVLCMDISKNKIIFGTKDTFQALNFPPEVLKVLKDAKVK